MKARSSNHLFMYNDNVNKMQRRMNNVTQKLKTIS